MKVKNRLLATGAVATLSAFGLLASVAGAQSTPPTQTPADTSPHPTALAGKLDKVDTTANTLTVTNQKGSTTVNVSANTWVLAQKNGKCAEASLSDLTTGKEVTVAGMTTTTPNQVNARTVSQGGCLAKDVVAKGSGILGGKHNGKAGAKLGAIADHSVAGTIKSISGSTIVVTSQRGDDVTINASADTVVLNGGFKDVSSLKAGDKVAVLGKPEAKVNKPAPGQQPTTPTAPSTPKPARTIDAWGIRVVSDNSKLFVGTVDKVDGNTVTIKTRPAVGISTVTLSTGTAFKSATIMDRKITVMNSVQSDIKAGSRVLVEGTPSADGKSVTADAVVVLPSPTKATK